MIVAVAILVAIVCVAASARRLFFVAAPTAMHPDDVVAALDRAVPVASLRAAAEREAGADWERDLFAALDAPVAATRAALVNEQLSELDLRIKRWDRVPRVCASVATSVSIMLATLVMRQGLADSPDLTGELGELFVRSLLNDAVSVASLGIVGTAFCIAAHTTARRLARDRLDASDRMVERLEAAVAVSGSQ